MESYKKLDWKVMDALCNKRMNPQQKAAWDAYYDPIIKDFKARKLEGRNWRSGSINVICMII